MMPYLVKYIDPVSLATVQAGAQQEPQQELVALSAATNTRYGKPCRPTCQPADLPPPVDRGVNAMQYVWAMVGLVR